MNPSKIRIACLQIGAGENTEENVAKAVRMIGLAQKRGAYLACLPEVFHYRGNPEKFPQAAQTLSSPMIRNFCKLAAQLKMGILLGSVLEKSASRGKFFNTSILISEKGRIAGVYRKIHRFDIHLRGQMEVSESKHILAGRKTVVSEFHGRKVGLSICYDLRFPELYRRLVSRGAEMIFVPANFTRKTGQAHWEILLRARAIENQIFVIAPAQVGTNRASRIQSFGTSLIIDPWGRILARGSMSGEEIITADLNFSALRKLRREFPVLRHADIKG